MRRPCLRRCKSDEGSSLVEFSLVAVLLLMVLLSVVEMTRMILVYTTMANAARAGVRYAMVHGGERSGSGADGPSGPSCPCTEVNTVVSNYAAAGLLDTSKLTITVSYPSSVNTAGFPVNVTVNYPYDPIIGYFKPLLSHTMGSTSEGIITF